MRDDADADQLAMRLYLMAASVVALGIFALDTFSPLQGAVAVLYTTVVLLASRSHSRAAILFAGANAALLALAGYVVGHWGSPLDSATVRLCVSLVAILITTLLCLRHHAATEDRAGSELRYRTIFNAAGIPIWEADWSHVHSILTRGDTLDTDDIGQLAQFSRVRGANEAAARLFGLADTDALVGGMTEPYHMAATREAFARIFNALSRGEPVAEEETQFVSATGETVDVVLRVTLPPSKEEWHRVLVMALDVTERNRTQARLAQAQAELAHVSRVTTLGQFAASIAHDVNQPLSAVMTYATSGKRWLAREAPDASEVADCLDHIAGNGKRAAEVIARIRDMARKADPKRGALALAPLIEESIEMLRRDLQTHGVAIKMEIETDLPSIVCDRIQIQQVLVNLMLNAEQAMVDVPLAEREMRVDTTRISGGVEIAVRDFGTGLAVDPETLFAPFFTTKPNGLGIGLSICRSILEQHGGSLSAANNADRGATFCIRLPLVTDETARA